MVDTLKTIVDTLNSLSPMGFMAGLAYIIYMQVRNKKEVQTISNNHLSGLPEMSATLMRMEMTLNTIAADIAYVKGRLNGK